MLPAKLLEYAACGIPIVAARLRTIEHYFADDSVRFFEAGNSASLADAIAALYFDRSLCDTLAQRASEVVARLSWPEQRTQFFNAIDSLLAG
jgi:glycosyltransferase involved in cell wall biosynthesis